MINAKHLMIGNLFTDDQNEILKIDLIDSVEETVNANGMEDISTSDLIPIELTEDILLKCGFGNKRNTNINGCIEYTYLNSMNLSKSYDLILTIHNGIYRLYYKLEIIGVRRLKYIHQFQNFFQIITEKELTVNL